MSRRKLEIIAAFVLLVALVIFLVWLLTRQPAGENAPQPEDLPVATDELPELDPADVPEQGVVTAMTVSRIFIERFGSYSSQSDFANVTDIMELATPRYQVELDDLVADAREDVDTEEYTGVSTFVISTQQVEQTDAEARFLVTTQRKESVGSPENSTVRYQDAEIALVKVGEDWLVDDLTWK